MTRRRLSKAELLAEFLRQAERIAAAVNSFHEAYAEKRRAEIAATGGNPDHFPTTRAVVCEWDGTAEEHAASLADGWDDYVGYIEANTIFSAPSTDSAAARDKELMRLREIASEYDACIRHMDAGGDFFAFQAERIALAHAAVGGTEGR